MPPGQRAIAGVNDSKQLSATRRVALAVRIREQALVIALGAASAREVDQLNIYHATVLAMRRALRRAEVQLGRPPDHVVVDGLPLRTLGTVHTAVVKGDATCYAIACASIIAKVTRDRLMTALSCRYDGYAWARNSGYGTAQHRAALAELGLTPHHRRSFCHDAQVALVFDPPPAPPTPE